MPYRGLFGMIRLATLLGMVWVFGPALAEYPGNALEKRWRATLSDLEEMPLSQVFPYDDCFAKASVEHHVPKPLLLAVARGESNFDPGAVSGANAYGIMQIRWPVTARHLGISRRLDLFDACLNIDAGARYLNELIRGFDNSVHRALAAYYYGPSRILKAGALMPSGADWYSDYIHGQLIRILADSEETYSRMLVRSSWSGFRTQVVLNHLRDEMPHSRFQMSKADGHYLIWLLHSNLIEFRHGVDGLRRLGYRPLKD